MISEGKFRRENYIYHFCGKLKGVDFYNLCARNINVRCEAASILVPGIVAEISTLGKEPWIGENGGIHKICLTHCR